MESKFELWVVNNYINENDMEIGDIRSADTFEECQEIMREYTLDNEHFTIVEYDDNNRSNKINSWEINIEGKTKDELSKLGYKVYLQCEDGMCAYIVENDNINLIAILNKNGTFDIDYDSEIILS
jgi:hypothetical protein